MRSPPAILLPSAILLAFLSARAATLHVPNPYLTIQDGIDAANGGDTVLVDCGTYYECISIADKNICLLSETGEYDCVTIDGLSDTTTVDLAGLDTTATIVGFTITGGSATTGGGVFCDHASITIRNCLITSNSAVQHGGGIFSRYSSLRLLDCEISDNSLETGNGGGLYIERGTPRLTNCAFFRNTIADDPANLECGGGAFFYDTDSLEVSGCIFLDNVVYGCGGGLFCMDDSLTTVTACTLSSNWSYTDSSWGGGLCVTHSQGLEISDCIISGNSADGLGGGLAGLYWLTLTMTGCVISGNRAALGGGGMWIDQPADTVRFESCTLASNRADGQGGGVRLSGSGCQYKFDDTILWGNLGLGGMQVYANNCDLWFRCCDVDPRGVIVIGGIDWGEGNINQYPEFCDPEFPWFAPSADGDFTIAETSPCTEAHSPSPCGLIGALGIGCAEPYNVSGMEDVEQTVPYLTSGFPNPFHGTTTIRFALGRNGPVSLKVYDVAGRLVKTLVDETEGLSYYEAVWDGTDSKGKRIASGVYFYRLDSVDFSSTRKTVLLR